MSSKKKIMMELRSANLVFLWFVCFWRADSHCVCFEENEFSSGFEAPCFQESLLSSAKFRLEEV